MSILYLALTLLITVQLLYPFVSILWAQLLGRERLKPVGKTPETDYACIITAYQNASIAAPLVDSLLRQTYPGFQVYLVADECPETGLDIASEHFVFLKPEAPLRLKAKSIKYAIEHFGRAHTHIVVFDADNLAHPSFLATINQYVQAGYRCTQGQRLAKNLDSNYAALDSLGEHYKNYIERQVPYMLGGSAVISGSGMATEANLYRAYLASPEIEQGQHRWKKMLQEDKILQNFLLNQGEKIAYARNAWVYDEKVASGAAVETQRSRWLFSYFQNLPNAGRLLIKGLLGLNMNQLYFGFVTAALPMFIQVGLALLLAIVGIWVAPLCSIVLLMALVVFGVGLLWALYLDKAPAPVWAALWLAPKFVLRQMAGLLKMRDPNKYFKHTEHQKEVSVDEVLKK